MTLKNMSDEQLLFATKNLVREERKLLTAVLHHLGEIERRKLYSALRYTSLFDYAVKALGYSEDQACRRISAMRLLFELPEIESKISTGELTLTNIGLAKTLFEKEKKAGKIFSKQEKLEIVEKLKRQPKRVAERIVLAQSSNPISLTPDQVKAVSQNSVEIRFVGPDELLTKIEILKGLKAHKNPKMTLAELFDELCELGLNSWHPARQSIRAARIR